MKWDVTDLECLAVIDGFETYKHYLSSRKVTVYTDHSSLNYLLSEKVPSGRLYRWALKLSPYNIEIKHRKGLLNQNADALSRTDYSRLHEACQTSLSDNKPSKSQATKITVQTHHVSEPKEVLESINTLLNDNGTNRCNTSKESKRSNIKSSTKNEKEYLETIF